MQKLIIIRGHSGAGKTTFALQQIAEFEQDYPHSQIFHIENDHFLMREGQYVWTTENFQRAKQQARALLQSAFDYCQQYKGKDVLIIISNVGVNKSEIEQILDRAEQLNLLTEIYRLQNFFQNQHNVDKNTIYSMYLGLQENSVENEIFVEPIMPMSEKVRLEIEEFQRHKRKNHYIKKI